MSHLYQALARKVAGWRADGYPSPQYPAIAEIFDWASEPDTGGLRFLRRPQLCALETYWYLRLAAGTPHILDLYRRLFPSPPALLDALGFGIPTIQRLVAGVPLDVLWDQIKTDDRFVRDNRHPGFRDPQAAEVLARLRKRVASSSSRSRTRGSRPTHWTTSLASSGESRC